jgi:hypothetical protein
MRRLKDTMIGKVLMMRSELFVRREGDQGMKENLKGNSTFDRSFHGKFAIRKFPLCSGLGSQVANSIII